MTKEDLGSYYIIINYVLGTVKKSKLFKVIIENCSLKITQPRPVLAQQYTVFQPAISFEFAEFGMLPNCARTDPLEYTYEVKFESEGSTVTNSTGFV